MLSTFHMGLQIECRCNIRGCFIYKGITKGMPGISPGRVRCRGVSLVQRGCLKTGLHLAILPYFDIDSWYTVCWHPLYGESAGLSLKYHSRESCRGIVPSAAKFPLFSWRRSAGRCTNFNQTPQNHETILSATERGPTIVIRIHMMGYNLYYFELSSININKPGS
jgi:hypothetical protein